MANYGIKLRVPEPPTFEGKTSFEDWSKKFTNYFCLQDLRFNKLLIWASTHPTEIDEIELGDISDQTNTLEDFTRMSMLVYYLLSSMLQGTPYVILDQVANQNGLEVWRRLYQRYAKTKTHHSLAILMRIMSCKFTDDTTLESTLAQWENDIIKFEAAIGKELYPEIKVGLLVVNTIGKLYDHLCLTIQDMTDYSQVKATVVNYVKTKQLRTHMKQNQPTPMEVDNIQKGGKGKKGKTNYTTVNYPKGKDGKGKGKTKNDSKGKSNGKGKSKETHRKKKKWTKILSPLQD